MLRVRLKAPDRTPSAVRLSTGFVAGRTLTFDKIGYDGSGKCHADLTGDPADRLLGVVYEIDRAEKPALDRVEGRGYELETLSVETPGGGVESVAYIGTDRDPALRPFDWYHALVVAGALENAFPAEYIDALRAKAAIPDADKARAALHQALLPKEFR